MAIGKALLRAGRQKTYRSRLHAMSDWKEQRSALALVAAGADVVNKIIQEFS